MNILVIGANGQTGKEVIKTLRKTTNFTPIAGVRDIKQAPYFKNQGIATRLIDIRETVNQIADKLSEIDSIVFTAGGGDSAMLVDLDGKVKTARAAEKVGVKRFVLVSAGGIQHFHDDDRLPWMDTYEEYSAAMYYGDLIIQQSDLELTIVRPGNLSNDAPIGKFEVGEYLPHKNITRADLATVVTSVLNDDSTIGKAFDVLNGKQTIDEVLKLI